MKPMKFEKKDRVPERKETPAQRKTEGKEPPKPVRKGRK